MKSGWIHVAGGGCRGQSRKALVSGYFQVPRSLQASNSWYQTSIKHISMCINAHTHTQKPTSHLHGTRWCWECDVHLDSSVRRLVLLNPHQSCSASPAVQETTPEKKNVRRKTECDTRTANGNYSRHPLHTSSNFLSLISNSKNTSDTMKDWHWIPFQR